jgi:putative transposase
MYNPEIHHRRSIRLRDFDYFSAGSYFVTVCAQNRECLFGTIQDGQVELNDAGKMVCKVWEQLSESYSSIDVDVSLVMPNHFHGIVVLDVGAGPRACPLLEKPKEGHPQGGAPTLSLPDIIHRFKSLTTAQYRKGVLQNGWVPFPGRLWQRNYYEHVIRNDGDLNHIRKYIVDNPLKWDSDENNPMNEKFLNT